MHLLVGLGNPGPDYAMNRHNVGFMAADAIAESHAFSPERRRFQGLSREGALPCRGASEKVMILKPQTYMNESGRAVGEALAFFKLAPSEVCVFHDEIDLAPGRVKVKTGGGHAGNNGVRSIASAIGPEFKRVRIGVGHPGDKARVAGHVLSNFRKADEDWLAALLGEIAARAPLLLEDRDDEFMSRIAETLAPPSAS
ncbi:MAG: aminoacyl-tRNA hydrolase [Alphaproteobacteria bacterium]|nr:aminoacyl-tRNA hydrolase [Alphaproteobacteria bacterium]